MAKEAIISANWLYDHAWNDDLFAFDDKGWFQPSRGYVRLAETKVAFDSIDRNSEYLSFYPLEVLCR